MSHLIRPDVLVFVAGVLFSLESRSLVPIAVVLLLIGMGKAIYWVLE
jgi:hypothetical protein